MRKKVWAQESSWGQVATPNMGANAKNAIKLSPDKCMMPLSYDLEMKFSPNI